MSRYIIISISIILQVIIEYLFSSIGTDSQCIRQESTEISAAVRSRIRREEIRRDGTISIAVSTDYESV